MVGRRAAGRGTDPAAAEPGLGVPRRAPAVGVPGRLARGRRPSRRPRAGPQHRAALGRQLPGYDWNDRRAVLDPAPRYLPGEVLIDDRLFVDGTTIPSEDPLVDEVADALEAEDPASALRELDVRWVVVEKGMPPGPVPDGETAVDGDHLTLVDLGAEVHSEPRRSGSTALILIGHILVTVMLLGSVLLLGFRAERDGVE